MNAAVIGLGGDEWSAAVERLDESDVYHLPAYHRVAEANGDGEALAFIAESGEKLLLHPFLRRPIERVGDEPVDGGWVDLESVYGYCGPVATTSDPTFLAAAWEAFADWCGAAGVVAEFIRFNPLLRNERLASAGTAIVRDRETVAVRLDVSADALWGGYPSVQRNMVRKARMAGLSAARTGEEAVDGFADLYHETMRRVGADAWYAFGDAYFAELARLPQLVSFEVREPDGRVAAAALFLRHRTRIHYHLAATRRDSPGGAANLLLHEAAEWGRGEGASVLHLGGGRTPAPDDALLRFKAALSRLRLPFYTGRRVHNREMYDDLCSRWLRSARAAAPPPYFLLYRLETHT